MNHDDNLLQRINDGLVFVSVLLCSPNPGQTGESTPDEANDTEFLRKKLPIDDMKADKRNFPTWDVAETPDDINGIIYFYQSGAWYKNALISTAFQLRRRASGVAWMTSSGGEKSCETT